MKKLDNFLNCLNILKTADFTFAAENDIYRTGILGQFNLTFELARKALQEVLRLHGVDEMLVLIRDSFIPAFDQLASTLQSKLKEVDS